MMSDACRESTEGPKGNGGSGIRRGCADTDSDLQFDSTSSTSAPSLRPPNLTEAQLLAAVELGFNEKYLPSSVTGEGLTLTAGNSISERSGSSRHGQSASMINNSNTGHLNSATGTNPVGGTQNQYSLFVDNYYSCDLTAEQQEGLLPALRRPDINQIPPDVLAVLLKSSRFEEILIPTQRRLTEIVSSTPGAIPAGVSSNNHRASEPDILGGTASLTQDNKKNSSARAEFAQQSAKFELSPLAKEFIPSSTQSSNVMSSQQENTDFTYAMSQIHLQDQPEAFQGLVEELDGSDCILSTVTDMISEVSRDPASLNRCCKITIDVLKKHLNDEDTLGVVVTLLIEQMVSNPNFCYSGARILESLREHGIGIGKSTIKPLVLTRMHEEFTHCLRGLDDPDVRTRSLGVLRLLSELYMNFSVLSGNSKLNIIALGVLELMEKLIQKDKSVETVKCVCQLLKLIGWEVENSSPEVRAYFDKVMKELSYLRMTSDGTTHPTCVALVDMIFKLRSNKWNREQQESSPAVTDTHAPASRNPNPVPVYYELPDSDEDYYDDEASIMIDDEPDEVQAAYEEFLKMNSKK